jgi:hypothetical protein
MLGYAAKEYARSFAEFGEPLALPRSGGWLLARALPDESGHDAMGCYPLFCCTDWKRLRDDLQDLPADIVAVSLVADPVADVSLAGLKESFPDVCYHYKDHYFADLSQPLHSFVASHHQRNAKQAAKSLRVERLENPLEFLSTWNELYGQLIERHDIRGQAAFSVAAFQEQFMVPGLRAYAAFAHDEIVGMVLWMVNEATAYYHLAAYSDAGYELKASFAVFSTLWKPSRRRHPLHSSWGARGTFAAAEGSAASSKAGRTRHVRPTCVGGSWTEPAMRN